MHIEFVEQYKIYVCLKNTEEFFFLLSSTAINILFNFLSISIVIVLAKISGENDVNNQMRRWKKRTELAPSDSV